MTRRRAAEEDPFSDVHMVRGGIERRIAQLRGEGPVGSGLTPSREQRDAILEFVNSKRSVVTELRVRTYLAWLPIAAHRLGEYFLKPDRTIQDQFSRAFPKAEYSRASREGAAHCLTTFWRWKCEQSGEDVPPWLKIRLEAWKSTNGAADMLSREEVAKMAECALNFRDKAWIWTLFNSGCRPGEVFQLTIGDVVPHDEGYIELRVKREKGSAPEPTAVYEDAVPALLGWLNAHPLRENPKAPLWVDLGGRRAGRPATYRAMYKALEVAGVRAGITKPVSAYALRRSRLTMLAKDPAISTSILEKVAGWVPGSKVARHYVHLSGKDLIDALNARYGVATAGHGDKSQPPRTPVKCGRCKTVNPPGAAFCMTCGGPLSLPAVRQIEEARAAESKIAQLLRRPEAIEFLARLLADQKQEGQNTGRRRSGSAASSPVVPPSSDTGPQTADTRNWVDQAVISEEELPRYLAKGWLARLPMSGSKFLVERAT